MASNESLRCEDCGEEFDIIDTLKGHQTSEREEHELRNKRLID